MWEERFRALSKKHEELQLESKDKDALIELLEDRVKKRQRESEVSSSSMPQSFVAWKKIVDQLVLEKTQMKASFETEIRRIQRKYARVIPQNLPFFFLEAYALHLMHAFIFRSFNIRYIAFHHVNRDQLQEA